MHPNQSEFFIPSTNLHAIFPKYLMKVWCRLGYMRLNGRLFTVWKPEDQALKEISSYLGVEAPTMTRTLARLEKSGWITRTAGKDKREKLISLTDANILNTTIGLPQ